MTRKLQRHVDDFKAAAAYYGTQEFADAARLGMTGFCFGGGITWRAATQMPELRRGCPVLRPAARRWKTCRTSKRRSSASTRMIRTTAPTRGCEELIAALEEAGVTFQINIYPDTQHAFHNDTGPRWNEEQALAAWNDTVAWFERT